MLRDSIKTSGSLLKSEWRSWAHAIDEMSGWRASDPARWFYGVKLLCVVQGPEKS
ncbi:hypothetical protein BGW80DRAFT_1286183 [Lactifluus volemus]|nr:hypothetical protein BGW80DRAFT_1286183 [Lactifluus volemus]